MALHRCAAASARPALELADIFRQFGPGYRARQALSLEQRKVMRAIECCRTAALGGHVDQCERCGHQQISYNSCGNRHCPQCQGLKQLRWIEARKQLLPIEYFHVVFTLPEGLNDLVRFNERVLYSLLGGQGDPPGLCRQALARALGHHGSAAHLGSEPEPASASALYCHRRGALVRPTALAECAGGLSLPRAGALAGLPGQVPRWAASGLGQSSAESAAVAGPGRDLCRVAGSVAAA